MKVAVVGVGYMGSNHVRVLSRIAKEGFLELEVKYVIDLDYAKAKKITLIYGGEPLRRVEDLKGEVDVAVVATPTKSHYETVLGLAAKNVRFILVEKPLVADVDEAVKLIEKVEKEEVTISVGFIERFNPAVAGLLKELENRGVNNVLTVFSRRTGPYSIRVRDVDVTLDLGSHEIDSHLLILKDLPLTLRAYGLSGVVSELIDHAWINMDYGEKLSFIETNRLSPVKFRELYVTLKNSVIALNYIDQRLEVKDVNYETNVKVKKEEPLFIEDLLNIAYYRDTGEALVDVYQAFLTQLLCRLVKVSMFEKREVAFNEVKEFQHIVEEGLTRLRRFPTKLADLFGRFNLA